MKKVIILDRHTFVSTALLHQLSKTKHQVYYSKAKLIYISQQSLTNYIQKINPTIIINAEVFTGGIHHVSRYPADVIYHHLSLSLNLYQAVKSTNPQIKIINLIPNCVYPSNQQIYTEKKWLNGPVDQSIFSMGSAKRTLYAISKCFYNQHKIKSLNLIVPNAYGPRDYLDPLKTHALNGIIIRMIKASKARKSSFGVWGSGKPRREWLYVNDLALAVTQAITKRLPIIDPLNIAQNQTHSIKLITQLIKHATGFTGKLKYNQHYQDGVSVKKMHDSLFRHYYPNFSFTPLKEGIFHTISFYQKLL